MLFFDAIIPEATVDTCDFPLVDEGVESLPECRIGCTAEAGQTRVILRNRFAALVHGRDESDVYASLDSAHATCAGEPV